MLDPPEKHTHISGIILYIPQLALKVLPGEVDSMVSISDAIEETDLLNSGNKRFSELLTGGLEAVKWLIILRKRSGWSP
jgi:hypothetical protein